MLRDLLVRSRLSDTPSQGHRSLQIISIRLLVHHIEYWHGTEPARRRTTNRPLRVRRLLIPDNDRLLPARASSRFGHELRVAALLQRDEPEDSFLDGLPDCQQAVILQESGLLVAETCSDVFALFFGKHDAVEAVIDDVVVVEGAGVLRDCVDFAAERAPERVLAGDQYQMRS